MRTYLSLLLLLLFVGSGRASVQQPFETFFRDSTLRLDYILTGGESTTEITPDEAHLLKGWAGRRHYLDSLVLRGNAQLYVHDEATGKLIYANLPIPSPPAPLRGEWPRLGAAAV